MKQISIKLDEETHEAFQTLLQELKDREVVNTLGDFIDELLNNYNSKRKSVMDNSQIAQELESAKAEIERLKLNCKTLDEHFHDSESVCTKLQDENDRLIKELEQAQAAANSNGEIGTRLQLELEAERAKIQDTDIIVRFHPVVTKLMDATIGKLAKRYNRTFSADQVLTMMFFRYTVEQRTEWFYPFVLRDREIEEITGKPMKELKNFLNE